MLGSDEIPIPDALEQQRETAPAVSDQEVTAEASGDVPLEASDADWQEQHEEIIDDPEERTDN